MLSLQESIASADGRSTVSRVTIIFGVKFFRLQISTFIFTHKSTYLQKGLVFFFINVRLCLLILWSSISTSFSSDSQILTAAITSEAFCWRSKNREYGEREKEKKERRKKKRERRALCFLALTEDRCDSMCKDTCTK
ncbi:hypothetical protein PUN28_001798 [Cardiocondyla obscurior]|uniref:Uncharacterized protein n=1 Tax=Cardiocondyla obscurior TaxID=286306 RepID=A0AAW2GR78_9HYME